MADEFQCVDCGMAFADEAQYRKHRADEHPRAETEDTLQGNANPGPEGVRHQAPGEGGRTQ